MIGDYVAMMKCFNCAVFARHTDSGPRRTEERSINVINAISLLTIEPSGPNGFTTWCAHYNVNVHTKRSTDTLIRSCLRVRKPGPRCLEACHIIYVQNQPASFTAPGWPSVHNTWRVCNFCQEITIYPLQLEMMKWYWSFQVGAVENI